MGMQGTAGKRRFDIDQRPRLRRLLPVVATGLAAVVATAYLRAVDPYVPGHYPGCPSKTLLEIGRAHV